MTDHFWLRIVDREDEYHWRWILADHEGNFITDYEVSLDKNDDEYRGFEDLPSYLRYYTPIEAEGVLLAKVGRWIGENVFGGIMPALKARIQYPATVVNMVIPDDAQELLFRPLELAHLDGRTLVEQGIRFVYQALAMDRCLTDKPTANSLRILAIFSLPSDASPLDLRQERYRLKRLTDIICQVQGVAIDLRVLQYGATRNTLRNSLLDGRGWDVIHFSGHGLAGELLLEKENGQVDHITTEEFIPLLRHTKSRVKLVTLSACLSGAASLESARITLGLGSLPVRAREAGKTQLPSLGQKLADELDCAVMAMRYPVGDTFAADLTISLYDIMFRHHQPLPCALQLALQEVVDPRNSNNLLPLSPITPVLFGLRSADLVLIPPKREEVLPERLSSTGLFAFPQEPERFVGRLMPMLRASQALAPESPIRGVIFHGMAGAGKTICAVELAHRHEKNRFAGFVWYRAPRENDDISMAMWDFLHAMEVQLDMADLALTANVDNFQAFKERTIPRLRKMLSEYALLIVLDGVEGLLTSRGEWRDPKWADLTEGLLGHTGVSRVVFTSRLLAKSLKDSPSILCLVIHALSLGESILLARRLPNLNLLFDSQDGRNALNRVLEMIQGHPKLLELADNAAISREALEQQLTRLGEVIAGRKNVLASFFGTGESKQEEGDFIDVLRRWTNGITSTLPDDTRLLFHFLCQMEDTDRTAVAIAANWQPFLELLEDSTPGVPTALEAPEMFLRESLRLLLESGLIKAEYAVKPMDADSYEEGTKENPVIGYEIHPGIGEIGCTQAGPTVRAAVDSVMSAFNIRIWQHGLEKEMEGGALLSFDAARHAIPYLMSSGNWQAVLMLADRMITVDNSPSVLGMLIPVIRKAVSSVEGTPDSLGSKVVLAKALMDTFQYSEAERLLRDALKECEDAEDWANSSVVAGELINVFRESGRLGDAFALAERKIEFTNRAGLGPWSQLADQNWLLQILRRLGHHMEVAARVDKLRFIMRTLPEKSDSDEIILPWHAREMLLSIGSMVYIELGQWNDVLNISDELISSMKQRGASGKALAEVRLRSSQALLGLDRDEEARAALEYCRQAFEGSRSIDKLGHVYSTMAEVEIRAGQAKEAVKFQTMALRIHYHVQNPLNCARSHHNLGIYLEQIQDRSQQVLTHLLASAIISLQVGSDLLSDTLSLLARLGLPNSPPLFEEVVQSVEETEGINFRETISRLSDDPTKGDEIVKQVWNLVREVKIKKENNKAGQDALMADLPPGVRDAIESGDSEGLRLFYVALLDLPEQQRSVWSRKFYDAGIMPLGLDLSEGLRGFDALLHSIVAVARGKGEKVRRDVILWNLGEFDKHGWQLTDPVKRIWDGERDENILVADINLSSAYLVRRILKLAGQAPIEDIIASMPPAIREMLKLKGRELHKINPIFRQALGRLPSDESKSIVQKLHQLDWALYRNSYEYAVAQNVLGTLYVDLSDVEEKASNLRKAIEAHEEALKVFTPKRYPYEFAVTQNGLGLAYEALAKVSRDASEYCGKAIGAWNEALRVFTVEQYPYESAMAQNNIGNAYRLFAEVEHKTGNCRKAVEAFGQALKVFTLERYPREFALVQNNIGCACIEAASEGDRANSCEKALYAFNKSLEVRTLDELPYDYAEVQNNLGIVYQILADLGEDIVNNSEKAIHAFSESLKVRALDKLPYDYAQTQNNLGLAYIVLAYEENKAINSKKAIDALEKALKIRTFDTVPYRYAQTQGNLGRGYMTLAEVEDKTGNCRKAVEAFREALRVFTPDRFPHHHEAFTKALDRASEYLCSS